MTMTLRPDQERAIKQAIRAGQVTPVEEFIDRALAGLCKGGAEAPAASTGRTIFEQGLGLFGSPEDAALLDEVVSTAYQERHRPNKRGLAL